MTKATERLALVGLIVVMAALPANASARAARHDPRLIRLSTARLSPVQSTMVHPFTTSLTATDRFDLANVQFRTSTLAAGPVDIRLSATKAANVAQRADQPYGIDKWSLKGVGITAALPIGAATLSIGGDYAWMTRRLQVVQINPYRLGTTMAKAGLALDFQGSRRVELDYVSIARSSRHDALTRLAETVGGAPLTGNGPELSFTSTTGEGRGGAALRLSLASMQRPERDLSLADSSAVRHDTRAMMRLSVHF